jgi:hypothetical protein
MEPIVVSNQTEYQEARKAYSDFLAKNRFDVETGKGLNIIKKVDDFVTDYLFGDISRNNAEKGIVGLRFNETQAKEIIKYFTDHRPGDLYEIEQGLNLLSLQNKNDCNRHAPLIHIKNCKERIMVKDSVEIFGKSDVGAYRYSQVVAHDRASVTAFDHAAVFALNNSNILAMNQSHVVTKDMPYVNAWDFAIINANDFAVIIAKDKSRVIASDNTLVVLEDESVCKSFDNALVITQNQNKPDFLLENALHILDHPYINGNMAAALKLLITSAAQIDKNDFSQKLKEIGCVDPESTKKVFRSITGNLSEHAHKTKGLDSLWER